MFSVRIQLLLDRLSNQNDMFHSLLWYTVTHEVVPIYIPRKHGDKETVERVWNELSWMGRKGGEFLGLNVPSTTQTHLRINNSSNSEFFYHHHHQSLNREGRWGTTDDFATSFLHFSLFSTALWDLSNSKPVHSRPTRKPATTTPNARTK